MLKSPKSLLFTLSVFVSINVVVGKIDQIKLQDDSRDLIQLVSFGMYYSGYLNVSLAVTLNKKAFNNPKKTYRITIDKTHKSSSKYAQYGESSDDSHGCDAYNSPDSKTISMVYLLPHLKKAEQLHGDLVVNKTEDMANLEIFSDTIVEETPGGTAAVGHHGSERKDTDITAEGSGTDHSPSRKRRSSKNRRSNSEEKSGAHDEDVTEESGSDQLATSKSLEKLIADEPILNLPKYIGLGGGEIYGKLPVDIFSVDNKVTFQVNFMITVANKTDEGLYSIFFHNCANGKGVNSELLMLNANITGKNLNPITFLNAGEIPEPTLYYCVFAIYVLLSFVWLKVLRNASSGVFKTHYVMLTLCYCKALSALFHGTNYYYIGRLGKEETAWAVIYYISYLMKTVMLFITIILVGTGWTFIKHIFSDKEKKLFLIAIPLQLLVYISHVILDETEIATKAYSTWQTISIVVDLLCCAAILMPVIWSIRHLTEASQTDGKAALNLQKLRLFKSLYVMVISYIYLSRIVLYVLQFTLPYQFTWLADLFREVTVLMFLITLAYKFRPADDNVYFQIPPDSDEEEQHLELAVTQSGLSADTKRRNLNVDSGDVEKQTLIPKNRNNESSHELD